MKRNCLYTVNPWNTNTFACGGNKHAFGDFLKEDSNSYMGNWLGANTMSKGAGAMVGALGTAVGGLGSKLIGNGYDAAGVGNGITTIGSTIGGAVSQVNPLVGGIISAGSGIIGGTVNRLWGMKTDQEALNRANSDIASMKSFTSNANSFDNIEGPAAVASVGNVYKGGVFKKNTARRKNQALQNDLNNAVAFANNSVANNIENLQADQFNNLLANYAAFGGYFDMPQATGALGIMRDDKYIGAINNRSNAIAKANAFSQAPTSFSPLGNAFADGGGIHIKPSHKGLFTEKANRAGMGVQAYASHVLANKEDYPSSTVKQANFAKNAAGWKHDVGGSLEAAFLDNFSSDPLGAVMQYNRGLEAMAAQREAEEAAAAQQAAYDDMQKRMLAAETERQGLQSMLDSQGLTIQALMDAQRQNNYADDWKKRTGMEDILTTPLDSAVMSRMRHSLIDRGVTKRTVQDAVIANMMVESGGNPNAKNKNSSARGLMQWTTPRHPKAWDWDSQVDHIVNTLESGFGSKEAYEKFINTNDSAEAARIFRQYWERPEKHTYNWTDKWINKMYGDKKAFGGELGTNGTDFTNGLLEINTGGNHEENPYEGVQLGLDPQGIPNLVEEGETVYNDYVYSKRMKVPEFMKKQLGLGGSTKDEITFADASKKIAEASKERPNNPMDQEYLADALGKLAQVQEAERMRMQAEEANAEMEAMNEMNMAAYGGQLGNMYAGNGDQPQSIIRRVFGDSVVGDGLQWFGDLVSGKLVGDQIESAMGKIAEMSEPELEKFFNTGIGQRVAQYIVDREEAEATKPEAPQDYIDENGRRVTNRTIEAGGMGKHLARGTMRAAKGVNRAAYTAAKRALQQSKNVARGQMKPQGPTKTPQTVRTSAPQPTTVNQAMRQAASSAKGTANPWGVATSQPTAGLNVGRGTAPDAFKGLEGTLEWQQGLSKGQKIGYGLAGLAGVGAVGAGIAAASSNGNDTPARRTVYRTSDGKIFNTNEEAAAYEREYWRNRNAATPATSNGSTIPGVNDPYTNQMIEQLPSGNTAPQSTAAPSAETPSTVTPAASTPAEAAPTSLETPTINGYENWTPYKEGALEQEILRRANAVLPTRDELQKEASKIGVPQNNTSNGVEPYPTWMRYAPAFGAGIMTLTDALGLTNRPDYTYANKLEAAAERLGYAPNVKFNPIGDYMTYRPLDRLFYANQLQANARATDRALANTSGGNRGTAQAAMLANGYNTNNSLGNLYRQAEEYNLAQREKVADFNRRTNMFNSQMALEADSANARYRQMASHASLQGLAQAAAMRDSIDQRVGAARSANLTNLLNSLGNIGRENFALNQINWDRSNKYGARANGTSYYKKPSAHGGKINKRK